MLLGYQVGGPEFQFREDYSWIPAFGMRYTMGVDGLSVVLVVLTTVLSVVAILYSWTPIQTRVKEYYATMLLLMVGMLGVFVALDLFLFYVFWEISLIPMYLVIGIWGGARRIYATVKFVIYTLVGSLLMLVAILAVAIAHGSATGNFTFSYEALRGFSFASNLQALAFIAFFLAFAIKVPMWPLHTWLPDAHVEAPTAGSIILAGVLLKLGGYGFLRYAVPLLPDAAKSYAPIIIGLAIIGILYGALVSMVQPDLKKLIAYSSVSHMGFVMLGTFVFNAQGLQGAVFQMISHGVTTGALFLLVGVIYERTHDRLIAHMGGLNGKLPQYAAIFGLFTFASIGLPGLSGFIGEFLVLLGTFRFNGVVAGITTVGGDPQRGLHAVDVPARLLHRAVRLDAALLAQPQGHDPTRMGGGRAARGAGRGAGRVPGTGATPDRGPGAADHRDGQRGGRPDRPEPAVVGPMSR